MEVYIDYSIRKLRQCEVKVLDRFLYEANQEIVGAVWGRIMNDYGHVDNETPSFAISILTEYRNFGIGTELMKRMLAELKLQEY